MSKGVVRNSVYMTWKADGHSLGHPPDSGELGDTAGAGISGPLSYVVRTSLMLECSSTLSRWCFISLPLYIGVDHRSLYAINEEDLGAWYDMDF